MSNQFIIFLAVIIPAIISSIPLVIKALAIRQSKGMVNATVGSVEGKTADTVTLGYERLVDALQVRIDKMEKRLEVTERTVERFGNRIRHLERGVFMLVNQVKSLGGSPVFDITEASMALDDVADSV